jgi:hypothetical protein
MVGDRHNVPDLPDFPVNYVDFPANSGKMVFFPGKRKAGSLKCASQRRVFNMMFSTTLAAMAVSGFLANANLVQPTWVTDYSNALTISAEQS